MTSCSGCLARLLPVLALSPAIASGAPVVDLHPANEGIGSLSFTFDPNTNTLFLTEVWTSSNPSLLRFSGLNGSEYTVVRRITNISGSNWTRMSNELLDPAGDLNDLQFDPAVYPGGVPTGYSPSNNHDQLSFGQGVAIPRTSSVFPTVEPDELGTRDYLEFLGATVATGAPQFTIQFGLQDTFSRNGPFLLLVEPTFQSPDPEPVPEPATYSLFAAGIAALMMWNRRRPA